MGCQSLAIFFFHFPDCRGHVGATVSCNEKIEILRDARLNLKFTPSFMVKSLNFWWLHAISMLKIDYTLFDGFFSCFAGKHPSMGGIFQSQPRGHSFTSSSESSAVPRQPASVMWVQWAIWRGTPESLMASYKHFVEKCGEWISQSLMLRFQWKRRWDGVHVDERICRLNIVKTKFHGKVLWWKIAEF